MGEDFRFSNAHKYFISSDNLINYWNTELYEKTNIWLKYSTPSMYVDAVNQQEIDWPVKYDDFFPYADHEAAYWTGYFSSRANAKKFFRDGQHTYHASNKLFSSLALDPTTTDE
jgi:hypothetical protein